ncbi:hypothetical protein FHG87_006676 [Trinorchestia longiramus]|nr:hypothetical protein FHG87_006676 [Trinorchestia longiramus]
MPSFTSCACLLLMSTVLLLQLHAAHAARIVPGRGGLMRMGGHKPDRGRTVRYRVDGRRPEKYFMDESVVRRGRPTQLPRRQRPVMRATGGVGTGGAPLSEPRTVRNFMNRFRSLLISPINRWTGLAL